MEYKKHKYNIYPEMQPDEFNRLREDIFINGYDSKKPIWLYEGEIIDGWNRYRACLALGVTPHVKNFEGSDLDAIQFIVRSNNRRDLNSSQRAAIAVDAEDLILTLKAEAKQRQIDSGIQYGKGAKVPQLIAEPIKAQDNEVRTQLAKTFNTNRQYISDAARIKKENPKAFEQIKTGVKVITEVKKDEKSKAYEVKKQLFNEDAPKLNNEFHPVIYFGNSAEVLINNDIPKCDLLLCDPPYGMDFKSNYVDPEKWDKVANDERPAAIDTINEVFNAIKPHLEPDAHIYVFGNPMEVEYIKPIFEKYFKLKNILIWDREIIGMGNLRTYGRSYDIIYFGYNETWKDLNGVRDRDILRFPRVAPGNLAHPTQKPLSVLEYIIKKSTLPGQRVIDPFAGSFTTCEAAMNMGRYSIGIDLINKYAPKWIIKTV